MKVKNPVSESDALLFDGYIAKWQAKLSLNDWRIERSPKPARNAMASVEFDEPARLAIYKLGDFGGEAITPKSLEATAVHELLHISLHDLIDAAFNRERPEVIEAAEHRVVNLIEKILLQDNYSFCTKCIEKGAND